MQIQIDPREAKQPNRTLVGRCHRCLSTVALPGGQRAVFSKLRTIIRQIVTVDKAEIAIACTARVLGAEVLTTVATEAVENAFACDSPDMV